MDVSDRRRFKKRLGIFQCGTYDTSREPGKVVPMGVSSVHLCTTSVEVANGRGDFDEERMHNGNLLLLVVVLIRNVEYFTCK